MQREFLTNVIKNQFYRMCWGASFAKMRLFHKYLSLFP
jgi:hypothetical protein